VREALSLYGAVPLERRVGYPRRMSKPVQASFGLVVRFDLIEGHERAFDELITETVRGIRESEPGTLEYVIHLDPSRPGVRVFYELYEDEAAFQGHEAQAHVQRFLRDRAEHLRTDPEVWRVVPAAGVIRTNLANMIP